jgi:pantothenate kinase type III
MMQNSLQLGTARIESTDDGPGVYSLGDTTNGCIQYGVSEAVLGFIERMERMAFSLCGDGVTVIITGGDAAGLLPHLHGNIRYVKDLVFLGMAGIVEEMRGGKAL